MRTTITCAVAAIMLSGCPPPEHPDQTPNTVTCFNFCNSNQECQSPGNNSCRFCSFGRCSNVSPEAPVIDAGVDASP